MSDFSNYENASDPKLGKMQLDLDKIIDIVEGSNQGGGVMDVCINCGLPVISTHIIQDESSSLSYSSGADSVQSKSYAWTHDGTRLSKCEGIENRWAAGTKWPPR